MTETIQQPAATVDGLPVDTTVQYKLDAGKCEACGHFKTWGFKVQNAKSGKMMPGHVTAEGYKIGAGDCPKWARIADMNKKRADKKASAPSSPSPSPPPPPGQWIRDIVGSAGPGSSLATPPAPAATPAPAPAPALAPAVMATLPSPSVIGPEPGPVVSFTVNGFTISTSISQAASVVEQIGASMRRILLSGA